MGIRQMLLYRSNLPIFQPDVSHNCQIDLLYKRIVSDINDTNRALFAGTERPFLEDWIAM